MNPFDVAVTLTLGTMRRVIASRDLARALDLPRLPAQLLAVLFSLDPEAVVHSSSTREKGVGGRERSPLPGTDGFQDSLSGPFVPGGEAGGLGDEGEGRGRTGAVDNSTERLADYLASALRDEKSTTWFLLVAKIVPREVIRDALTRALDVPSRDVRRSRAAIFTALVRPYVTRRP